MLFDGVSLWRSCLRSFLGELGDKTFFLAVVFAAWCPWDGIRSGDDRFLQLCLVFSGSFLALALHSLLVLTVVDLGTNGRWTCTYEVLSFVVLAMLGMKAKLELGRADANARRTPTKSNTNPFQADDPEEDSYARSKGGATDSNTWNKQAFGALSAPFASLQPREQEEPHSAYGSMPPPTSADGVFSDRISDRLVSHTLAFIAPLVLIFLTEGEDKSQDVLGPHPSRSPQGSDIIVGTVLGFMPSVALAVLAGFVLERSLSDQRMLFFVTCVFFGLALVAVSQALLHTGAASPALPASAQQALLAVVTMVRTQTGM
uniref:GDT1 family protein n=1 Tax=Alexandrium catenella TaxID=2925 RepID=A0A7S1QRU6_ALECA|mmetsp:Transcript_37408/g.101271  ORF Transcript_37408/g.101271 Transcript_37408/m.101271 type:complete len:316 (+) Transcript_37408:44-991(+)